MAEDKLKQPFVSFFVFSYNQEEYIKDAIHGSLSQDYNNLEVIFSDDCSTDRTYEIIKEEVLKFKGSHKIILNRNTTNLGLAGNINAAFKLAKGDYFIMAAGDDISLPHRTKKMIDAWISPPGIVDLVCSFCEDIDQNGNKTGFIKKDVVFLPDVQKNIREWGCGATGACAGYSRKLFDKYGPLDPRIVAEDWVFSFRAWVDLGIRVIEEPLVQHRTHSKSLSVLHQDVNKQKKYHERRNLRKNAVGNKLARAIDWKNALEKSGSFAGYSVHNDIKQWIELLDLEWKCYASGRLSAVKSIIVSVQYPGWYSFARRIFFRHVVGLH